ncbi:diaminopimelate decarboxylase [Klebsiella pneumoniae]|uniref:Diaminopimelate decarboxylase n=1 Tax=Klebsiella pneumoniae TaxID=573 RepID=A0A377XFN4_KLEPN|nr:diaminopimelate decarboxylase [Klebsiella pneumoniae]
MHIGSGVDYGHLEQVCGAMVRQVVDFGQDLQAISAGGGLSIPYREGEEAIDTATIMACGTAPGSRSRPIWGTR